MYSVIEITAAKGSSILTVTETKSEAQNHLNAHRAKQNSEDRAWYKIANEELADLLLNAFPSRQPQFKFLPQP